MYSVQRKKESLHSETKERLNKACIRVNNLSSTHPKQTPSMVHIGWYIPQVSQWCGFSPECRTLCFNNFLCMLKDFPHWSHVNVLSVVWVFLCSFKLLKLLNPEQNSPECIAFQDIYSTLGKYLDPLISQNDFVCVHSWPPFPSAIWEMHGMFRKMFAKREASVHTVW